MATARKKTSGFSAKPEEVAEEQEVRELLELALDEILKEEAPEPKKETDRPKAVTSMPVVIESIIPTEDIGPRFVDTVTEGEKEELNAETARPQAPPPKVHPPKRHPRNIPKYSRYKEV